VEGGAPVSAESLVSALLLVPLGADKEQQSDDARGKTLVH
jgi:hypothetical protein